MKTPHQKPHSGHDFEPSEYNNVSKFQLVQSRLLEPTKASLESRREGKGTSKTARKESAAATPGKLSTPRHVSHVSKVTPKPGGPLPARRIDPQLIDIENDMSSLREESVTSSLVSALTESDSHVSPLEHAGATPSAHVNNNHHYAPPIIAKHGIASYNHVQVYYFECIYVIYNNNYYVISWSYYLYVV